MINDKKIKDEVIKIVQLLSTCDYDAIVEYTNGVRLPADEIRYAVEEYGRTVILPPATVFEELDVIEVVDANPGEWSVRCPLWTKEEGRSDLTLELSLIDLSNGKLRVEVDNLIVL